jgi:drug/metabolite transporter (DMT)-like permease
MNTLTVIYQGKYIYGLILAILSAFCFATAGPLTKAITLLGIDSLHIVQFRMGLAALFLVTYALIKYPHQLRIHRQEWLWILSFGVMAFCINQTLYTFAVSRIPVGITLLLEYLAPVMILLWLKFRFGFVFSKSAWVGMSCVILGLIVIADLTREFQLDLLGILAGIGTAIALMVRFLLIDKGLQSRNPLALAAIGTVIGTMTTHLFILPFSFPWEKLQTPVPLNHFELPVWSCFLCLSLISTALAYALAIYAQKYINAVQASQLATLEVVFAMLLAAIFIDEYLSLMQTIGTCILLMGILISQVLVKKFTKTKA